MPRKPDDVETLKAKLASSRTLLSRERGRYSQLFDLLGKIIDQVKEKGSHELQEVVEGLVEEAEKADSAAGATQAGGVGAPESGDAAGGRSGERGEGEAGAVGQGA